MAYAVLIVAIAVFMACVKWTRLIDRAVAMAAEVHHAFMILRAPDLSEDRKERAARHAAIRTCAAFFSISSRLMLAFAGAGLFIGACAAIDIITLAEAQAAAFNWVFILGSTAALLVVRKRLQ